MPESPIVLIVDDEDPLLRLMTRLAEKAGRRTLAAATGREARDHFEANRDAIGCVILDVTMPEDDGAALLMPEFLAARPDLEVIVTSGDAPRGELEEAIARAGATFLRKPFAPKQLLSMLTAAASSSASSSAGPPPSSASSTGPA